MLVAVLSSTFLVLIGLIVVGEHLEKKKKVPEYYTNAHIVLLGIFVVAIIINLMANYATTTYQKTGGYCRIDNKGIEYLIENTNSIVAQYAKQVYKENGGYILQIQADELIDYSWKHSFDEQAGIEPRLFTYTKGKDWTIFEYVYIMGTWISILIIVMYSFFIRIKGRIVKYVKKKIINTDDIDEFIKETKKELNIKDVNYGDVT